jgi:hypothetical protein
MRPGRSKEHREGISLLAEICALLSIHLQTDMESKLFQRSAEHTLKGKVDRLEINVRLVGAFCCAATDTYSKGITYSSTFFYRPVRIKATGTG